MKLREILAIDIKANSGNKKGQFIVVCFRITHSIYSSRNRVLRILGFPIVKLYHWIFIWLLGIEIPENTSIGPGFQVWHGSGLVINHQAIIGANFLVRHCVTIGNKGLDTDVPVIGNNVQVGANSVIIGGVNIGNNVIIGAGSVVTKSIPDDCIAYGNPAKYKTKD